MNRKETIKQKLGVLNPHFLEVEDNSAHHIGHLGNPSGDGETHFKIKIASEDLTQLTLIEQHRKINNLLKEEFANGLHAVSITIIKNKYHKLK
ncbi:MAG: BolA family transcriptional regulator [Rickettsiaceae bacterium]